MLDNERMWYGGDETDAYHVKMLVSLTTLTRIGNASSLSILTSFLQPSLSFPEYIHTYMELIRLQLASTVRRIYTKRVQ